jgi:hypothetical protein
VSQTVQNEGKAVAVVGKDERGLNPTFGTPIVTRMLTTTIDQNIDDY